MLARSRRIPCLNYMHYMHYILCIVFNALYAMHCIIFLVFYALYSMNFILCISFYILHSMHCILCSITNFETGCTPTDRQTNRQTDIVTYRAAIAAKKNHHHFFIWRTQVFSIGRRPLNGRWRKYIIKLAPFRVSYSSYLIYQNFCCRAMGVLIPSYYT